MRCIERFLVQIWFNNLRDCQFWDLIIEIDPNSIVVRESGHQKGIGGVWGTWSKRPHIESLAFSHRVFLFINHLLGSYSQPVTVWESRSISIGWILEIFILCVKLSLCISARKNLRGINLRSIDTDAGVGTSLFQLDPDLYSELPLTRILSKILDVYCRSHVIIPEDVSARLVIVHLE